MPLIQQLSASVVNKIAAGEVIERPASVVKELVENALDAGSTRVEVAIEQGGSELIRVADNGCGIEREQLPLAVASHATSKICSADDLFSVATLGFRGEALASIAAVSRLLIRSRTPDAQAGAELEIVGGQARPIAPCGCAVGTTIEVRNLFYNTPVRRKFLRTAQTEVGHITEAFTRLALAHPDVHFTLRNGTRVTYDLPPAGDWKARIERFFGGELADSLIEVRSTPSEVRLAGYVASPTHSRAHSRMQYLFLNGRHIRDRALQHALGEAYRGLLLVGRHPICFLRLEMPPELVDVNVHPTKLEVRFQDSSRVYSQVLGTLRTKFLTTDLTAKLQPVSAPATAPETRAADVQQADRQRRELVDWAKSELARHAQQPLAETPAPPAQSAQPDAPLSLTPLPNLRLDRPAGTSLQPPVDGAAPLPPRRATSMQIHNRYLIAESDDGMLIIDQHALHERVLYEQIREKVLTSALETQHLLVPEPVDLTAEEAAAVLEQRELLTKLGIKIEPFGGDTVLISSYPAMLARTSPRELLRFVVDQLLSGGQGPERRDLLDSLLHMISCKAAIKAGDRLSPEEVAALVEQRHLAQDAHHCPHGRPTVLEFTRDQLDRQFRRI